MFGHCKYFAEPANCADGGRGSHGAAARNPALSSGKWILKHSVFPGTEDSRLLLLLILHPQKWEKLNIDKEIIS